MFDGGVSDQIHRFITSPPPPQLQPQPPPLPTPERSLPVSFSTFNTNHETQQHMMNLESRKIIHYHHHHHHHDIKDGEWMSHIDHDAHHHHHHHHHPWCSDEVLALLRFRSTVENWLPEFTWEHTSRKLTEIGFKRSPQECKEKYEEEERRYFSSNNNTNDHISNYNHNKGGNYKMFSEVEEFYHHDHNPHHDDHDDVDDDDHASSEVGHNQNKSHNSLEEEPKRQGNVNENGQDLLEEDKREEEELIIEKSMKSIDVDDVDNKTSSSSMLMMKEKKRKRKKKEKERFSVLKGFCEGLVRNMMSQQEEMHKKLLEDMLKRDKEKIERDEALKKQEMERINKEIEVRAHEQAIANDRSTNIIKFISNLTDHDDDHHGRNRVQSPSASQGSSSLAQSRKSQTLISHKTPLISPQSSEPISIQPLKTKTQIPKPQNSDERSDLGKRWPRDEVLTLVNIRRSISTMNMNDDQDGISKAVPLWERISKKMLENGYKRSAKRCKEKWENINKYFRKTKDVNKKRPLDSRTCPYFHQLTALYTQVSTTTSAEELPSQDPKTRPDDPDSPAAMNVDADGTGQRSNVQYSSFDLEF